MLQDIEELSYTYYSQEMVKDRLYERLQLLLRTPQFDKHKLFDLYCKYTEYVQHVWKHKYPDRRILMFIDFITCGIKSNIQSWISIYGAYDSRNFITTHF